MSKVIYNTLPAWKKQLINNPSDYIQSMFEPDEWFDIVVNELEEYAPWNKGKTAAQEYTAERNAKISKALTGKTHTEETKALMSKLKLGNTNKKGTKCSAETKTKMSKSHQLGFHCIGCHKQVHPSRFYLNGTFGKLRRHVKCFA